MVGLHDPLDDADRAAVAQAARMMDQEHPGWAARINVQTLNLSNCEDCILGQVRGWARTPGSPLRWGMAMDHLVGRSLAAGSPEDLGGVFAWRALEPIWVAEINRRVAPATAGETR